jgi:hypothetical protein
MKRITRRAEAEERERIEALLRAAADYAPARSAPDGLAARALARHSAVRCAHGRRGRHAVLVGGAALVLLALALRAHWGRRETVVTHPNVVQAPHIEHQSAPEPIPSQPSKMVVSERPERPQRKPDVRIAAHLPAPASHRRHGLRAPKALWRVETVREVRAGVLIPTWMAVPDAEQETVHLRPAVLNIPLQAGESICLAASRERTDVKTLENREETVK